MEKKTLTELRRTAKQKGLVGYSTMERGELIRYIKTGNRPKTNPLNRFFDKIYVINLADKTERWKRVSAAFRRRGIRAERFEAVDGRCKGRQCAAKKLALQREHGVRILKSFEDEIPAASLVIGTILILREMVANRWERVLVCEDDIVLGRDIKAKFAQGVRELTRVRPDWDVLYLGCGNKCGHNDIAERPGRFTPYKSEVAKLVPEYGSWYVRRKDDLRGPCDPDWEEELCPRLSKNLSKPARPAGTWAYAYSLKGARKFLKFLNNRVSNHIDKNLEDAIEQGVLKAVAFDPPIIWHYKGALRPDSDIPWEW